jgi:hypothetical protein
MRKMIAAAFFVLAAATVSMAGDCIVVAKPVPEIDAAAAFGAMSLIAGAVLVIRGRVKK